MQVFPQGKVPALFKELALEVQPRTQVKPRDTNRPDLKQLLVAAPESDRQDMLITFVTSQAAKVMGTPSSRVLDIKTPFNSLGLDSLMAVELRNGIAEAVGHSLPASLTYDYSTIEALSGYLFSELLADEISVSMTESEQTVDDFEALAMDELDGLSQEDMAQLLAKKIASLNQENSE
jgi:acyl carrier protein